MLGCFLCLLDSCMMDCFLSLPGSCMLDCFLSLPGSCMLGCFLSLPGSCMLGCFLCLFDSFIILFSWVSLIVILDLLTPVKHQVFSQYSFCFKMNILAIYTILMLFNVPLKSIITHHWMLIRKLQSVETRIYYKARW